MLTGTRAFAGESTTEVLGAILHVEPDWAKLPAGVPPIVRALVQGCLVKDQKHRIGDLSAALFALNSGALPAAGAERSTSSVPPRSRRKWFAWTAAGVALAAALAAGFITGRSRSVQPLDRLLPYKASLLPPPRAGYGVTGTVAPGQRLALSADGRRLAFVGVNGDGTTQLWIRDLSSMAAQALAGTANARSPFWSPDGRSLAFVASNVLKRVDLASGAVATICAVPGTQATGGTWNADGVILVANNAGPILEVPSSGGQPTPATVLDPTLGQLSHWYPYFLPDGRHFLFTAVGEANQLLDIRVGSLDGTPATQVLARRSNAQYANGHIVFLEGSTLLAARFEPDRLTVSSDAISLADDVDVGGGSGRTGAFAVSNAGTLVYQARRSVGVRRLTWYDRAGHELGYLGDAGAYTDVELSRDGKRALVAARDSNEGLDRRLWVFDAVRGTRTRLTFDAADARRGVWSPDGNWVAYSVMNKGRYDLFRVASTGAGSPELLLHSDVSKLAEDWSPDGRFILYWLSDGGSKADILALPLAGERTPLTIRATPFGEGAPARFSPDGKWIAYWSDESGRPEVYVSPFPDASTRVQASADGGDWPRWSANGKELFYVRPDYTLMAVAVERNAGQLTLGAANALFQLRVLTESGSAVRYPYDVAPDGRFLVNTMADIPSADAVTLVVNWPSLVAPAR
jgi:Tol biopolymer transport system component